VVGNMMGWNYPQNLPMNPTHRSNQGWGVWEVNPRLILDVDTAPIDGTANAPQDGTEYKRLFLGMDGLAQQATLATATRVRGRYDNTVAPVPNPAPAGSLYPAGSYPRVPLQPNANVWGATISGNQKVRVWSQVDFNGAQDTPLANLGAQANLLQLPAAKAASGYFAFPTYPTNTYNNGGPGGQQGENTNHPEIYNLFTPGGSNRLFPVASMVPLLRFGGTGSDVLTSDLLRLLPQNLVSGTNATLRRNQLTLLSMDLDRPGAVPYIWDPATTNQDTVDVPPPANQTNPANASTPNNMNTRYRMVTTGATPQTIPTANPIPFPSLSPIPGPPAFLQRPVRQQTVQKGSDFDQATWRASVASALRLDLNYRVSQLTAYPAPDANGRLDATVWPTPPGPPPGAPPGGPIAMVQQANQDRQTLAMDIFNALRRVTGAMDPSVAAVAPYGTTSPEYAALRYLAQLAVNIVDFMDNDDYSTCFNWFTPTTAGAAPEYVFGVELPRLVVNESYVQVDNVPAEVTVGTTVTGTPKNYNVNVWAELMNPVPDDTNYNPTGEDTRPRLYVDKTNPTDTAYAAYRILLATRNNNLGDALTSVNTNGILKNPANTLGDPDFGLTAAQIAAGRSRIRNKTQIPGPPATTVPGQTDWGTTPATRRVLPFPANNAFNDPAKGNTGFYVIGPPTTAYLPGSAPAVQGAAANKPGSDPNLPTVYRSAGMTYQVPASNTVIQQGTLPQPTIMLQRLANPALPPNPNATLPTPPNPPNTPNPLYNPYITIDWVERTANNQVNDGRYTTLVGAQTNIVTPPQMTNRSAWGRVQPYDAFNGGNRFLKQPAAPAPAMGQLPQPNNTFYQQNSTATTAAQLQAADPTAGTGDATLKVPFDWLIHLDRILVSPMDLLHVAGYKPHELTQKFVTGTFTTGNASTDINSGLTSNQHAAPWGVETTRLYRFLEFVSTVTPRTLSLKDSAGNPLPNPQSQSTATTNIAPGGRIPGRVNINGVWTRSMFQALADPQGGNSFKSADVQGVADRVIGTRSPGVTAGSGIPALNPTEQAILDLYPANTWKLDKPFWPFSLGPANGPAPPAPTNGPPGPDPFSKNARGINNTLLGKAGANSFFDATPTSTTTGTTPYQTKEMFRKVFSNLTTRSNVFAVWVTVGYFEVVDDSVSPVRLGAEIGRADNRYVRHRMFAIIDRTNLQAWPTTFVDPAGNAWPGAATVRVRGGNIPANATHTPRPPGKPPPANYPGWRVQLEQGALNAAGTTVVYRANLRPTDQWGVPLNPVTGQPAPVNNPFTGYAWKPQAGATLIFEPGTNNEETVVLQNDPDPNNNPPNTPVPGLVANTKLAHPNNAAVIVRGNPGPWSNSGSTRYDPRKDTDVVVFFAVID
jgi:hypothetical protein